MTTEIDPLILKLDAILQRHEADAYEIKPGMPAPCSTSILRDEILLLMQEVALEYSDRADDEYIQKRFHVK